MAEIKSGNGEISSGDRSYVISEQETVEIEKRFTYHAPKIDQPPRYGRLRDKAKELAETIHSACPRSREMAVALTKLEEVIMWANAAIARNE